MDRADLRINGPGASDRIKKKNAAISSQPNHFKCFEGSIEASCGRGMGVTCIAGNGALTMSGAMGRGDTG